MSKDPVSFMDVSRLRPADPNEHQVVDRGWASFSEWFHAVRNVTPHEFRGLPADIGIADWVFYELRALSGIETMASL